ncbi:MAG: hypothetical protein K2M86_02780 [Odoribacter sp.]|nr:hypothetical protein [Odoribacter sp.]
MQLLRNARSGGKAVSATIFLLRSVFYPKTLHLSTVRPKGIRQREQATERKQKNSLHGTPIRCCPASCFLFLYVDNAFGVVAGELRSLKKTGRHPFNVNLSRKEFSHSTECNPCASRYQWLSYNYYTECTH